jgi:DNA excision repair protein ERCC-1
MFVFIKNKMSSKGASANALLVNEVQKGNPVLQFIKNVKWEFNKDIVPDYVMGQTCAIFVSIKYHYKHPKVYLTNTTHIFFTLIVEQYVTKRIQEVGRNFRLRVLLVLVDDETNLSAIQDLNKIAFVSDFTLILAWSNVEGARYLETFKSYEGKSSASIQEKEETEYLPKVTKVLGNVRSVNKTDVLTLLDVFGSFSQVCQASEQQLILCPGMGDKKVRRLHAALHQPFLKKQRPVEAVTSSNNPYNSGGVADVRSSSSSSGDGSVTWSLTSNPRGSSDSLDITGYLVADPAEKEEMATQGNSGSISSSAASNTSSKRSGGSATIDLCG